MSQFKAGDLALIIGSLSPEKIGRVVEVLDVLTDDFNYYEYQGELFYGAADGSPSAFVDFGDGSAGIRLYEQRFLMPLRGQFTPETERETELTQ